MASDAEKIVNEAKAKAITVPNQAIALAGLAWPEGPINPAVSSLARRQLVGFGDQGLEAMRQRLRATDARFGADIASAVIETRLVVRAGIPHNYIAILYEIVWFGSLDAKRLAMAELAVQRFPPAMLAIIDSAFDYPELTAPVINALGRLGDDRARHYLGQLLMEADPEYSLRAAEALAEIGGRSIDVLREASVSASEMIRGAAIDALVPLSGVEDLTILYEYVAQFPEDDPRRIDLVIQRATKLESLLEARQDSEAGSSRDF
jgi:HEAT repeat protein